MIKFTTRWGNSQPSVPESAEQIEQSRERISILVAEDDPVSRELISTRLTKWGYEPVLAKDGLEAMTILRSNDAPSLAILDWMMPGMDGLEVCRRVREVERVLYIILLTVRSGKENLLEGLRAGADDYLNKPFDKDELEARILVGLRVIGLQTVLAQRVKELETAQAQLEDLRLRIPI